VSSRGACEGGVGGAVAPPEISVCILAGHGAEALHACLESLGAQLDPPPFELLIGGNPSPEARSAARRWFPGAQVCDTGRRLPGAARNPLIERARGELLLFLDDDVTVPPTLLRALADIAGRHRYVSVFGGPNDTPPESSPFQVVQGAVLSSLAGSGPVSRRYGARHPGLADERWFTLCNLAVRRQAMLPFLEELVCAEENELLANLRRRGEPMLYEPSLRVFHARRPALRTFARQMLKYGRGRGQLLARRPGTVRAAYLAPAALVVYLLLAPVLIGLGLLWPFALIPLAAYCALIAASSLWIGGTLRRPAAVPLGLLLVVVVHLCYGAGVLTGLLRAGRGGGRLRTDVAAPVRWASEDARPGH
jgi:succinoglycan biosynthesis protein ExoA